MSARMVAENSLLEPFFPCDVFFVSLLFSCSCFLCHNLSVLKGSDTIVHRETLDLVSSLPKGIKANSEGN